MLSWLVYAQPRLCGPPLKKRCLHSRSSCRTKLTLLLLLLCIAIAPGPGWAQSNPPSLDSYCDTATLPQSVLIGTQTKSDIDTGLYLVSIRMIATGNRFSSNVISMRPLTGQLFLEDGRYVRLPFQTLADVDGSIEAEFSCESIPERFGRPASPLHADVTRLENAPSIEGYKFVSVSGTRYGADSYLGLWVSTDSIGAGLRDSLLVKFSNPQSGSEQGATDFEILTRIPIVFDKVIVQPSLHGPSAPIYLISNQSMARGDIVIASLNWTRW